MADMAGPHAGHTRKTSDIQRNAISSIQAGDQRHGDDSFNDMSSPPPPIPLDSDHITKFKASIIAILPPGTHIVQIVPHGHGFTSTARVDTASAGDVRRTYFIKIVGGQYGKDLLNAEYQSMLAIHTLRRNLVPSTIAYGQVTDLDAYFLLVDFMNMGSAAELSKESLDAFIRRLYDLHINSAPPGAARFGIEPTTFKGKYAMRTTWMSDWTSFFTRLFEHCLNLDNRVNGVWPEYSHLAERILHIVIPRLLYALGPVRPALIHGDLWAGNAGIDSVSGDVKIFDAACLYAHRELEMGIWRCRRHQPWGKAWMDAYVKVAGGWDEPSEEGEDRWVLYGILADVVHSAHWEHSQERKDAFHDMQYLVGKYDTAGGVHGAGVSASNNHATSPEPVADCKPVEDMIALTQKHSTKQEHMTHGYPRDDTDSSTLVPLSIHPTASTLTTTKPSSSLPSTTTATTTTKPHTAPKPKPKTTPTPATLPSKTASKDPTHKHSVASTHHYHHHHLQNDTYHHDDTTSSGCIDVFRMWHAALSGPFRKISRRFGGSKKRRKG